MSTSHPYTVILYKHQAAFHQAQAIAYWLQDHARHYGRVWSETLVQYDQDSVIYSFTQEELRTQFTLTWL
jgi:hypothetical protein